MSFLIILLTSIDILYNPASLDWILVSSDEVARILDIYFPPEVISNITYLQYIERANNVVNNYEAIYATIFLSVIVIMFY